ncbi:ANTAR domain-containing protein [Motilibacter sp. E257]|uniref:ANTAR domain-containing protein n=1 Tax=Motilibacter deserti TaxID=2714956 RepID=A0ABX0GVC5_9ACTN|nr:ANTAR domain-containing protein [Motilibacter deserti]
MADEWDQLAAAHADAADLRDRAADERETRASGRDRVTRARTHDADAGFGDRFLSARDRDEAAGDRGESRVDRGWARRDRERAASARAASAADRQQALDRADADANEIAGLREALTTRHVIGLAQGILMERYDVDAERAFAMLVTLSSHANVKLRLVAEQIAGDRHRRYEPAEDARSAT